MYAEIEAPGMALGFRATVYRADGSMVETAWFPARCSADWSRSGAIVDAAYAAAKAWVALFGCV